MRTSITPLTSDLCDEFISTVNAYTSTWPYSRPIDRALVDHWRTLGFTDDRIQLLRHDGKTLACIHGDVLGDTWQIHLLTLRPGVSPEIGSDLLAEFCRQAKAAGSTRIVGPNSRTMLFYGGFVLGNEPYHPHFATSVTDVYINQGFHVSHPAVIMVADSAEAKFEPLPDGYQIVPVSPAPEYQAQTFGFHAIKDGAKAAHCYARLYPSLHDTSGQPVGQIGNVTTEPDHRNRGLARRMVLMSLQRLHEMGAGEVLIATGLENYPALRAYERCGFVRRHFIIEWTKKLL